MRKFALIAVLIALLGTSVVYAAPSLIVSPNPVSQGQSYVISGCGFKRTEFTQITITSPSGATLLTGGWLGNNGCLYANGDLVPLVVTGFSSELGQYKVDMKMLFVGPKGIVASTVFTVQ